MSHEPRPDAAFHPPLRTAAWTPQASPTVRTIEERVAATFVAGLAPAVTLVRLRYLGGMYRVVVQFTGCATTQEAVAPDLLGALAQILHVHQTLAPRQEAA